MESTEGVGEKMQADARELLLLGLAGVPQGEVIEMQEKRGQTQFVRNATLPKQMSNEARDFLVAQGVQFGEEVDDLFVQASLPEGWQKVATGHSMWSDLLNKKGEKVALIFYKAAFYDRDAFLNLVRTQRE